MYDCKTSSFIVNDLMRSGGDVADIGFRLTVELSGKIKYTRLPASKSQKIISKSLDKSTVKTLFKDLLYLIADQNSRHEVFEDDTIRKTKFIFYDGTEIKVSSTFLLNGTSTDDIINNFLKDRMGISDYY